MYALRTSAATTLIATTIVASSALGADPQPGNYRTKATGAWSAPSTWQVLVGNSWLDAESYPQAGDFAGVRQHTVSLTQNAQLAALGVNYDGVITTSSHTLTVNGSDLSGNGLDLDPAGSGARPGTVSVGASGALKLTGASQHRIDGSIVLQGSQSKLLCDSIDTTLQGSGTIIGCHKAARIQIGNGYTLASQILIQGMMLIESASGTGTFVNKRGSALPEGRVRANANGTLELASNLAVDDMPFVSMDLQYYYPSYEAVEHSGARLKISFGAGFYDNPPMQSDFIVDDCATLEFVESVVTEGTLFHEQGTVIVAPGKLFTWNATEFEYESGAYAVGSCP